MSKLYWWIIAILLTWVLVIRPINMTGKKSEGKNEQEPEGAEDYTPEGTEKSNDSEKSETTDLPVYMTGSKRGFTT